MKKNINQYKRNFYEYVEIRKRLREHLSFPHLLEDLGFTIYPNYMINSIYVNKQKYPSIHIDVKNNVYYCRIAKSGGDIVKLYMVYKNLEFFDAIDELCGFGSYLEQCPDYYDNLSTGKELKIEVPERVLYFKLFRIYAGRNMDIDDAKELAYQKIIKRRKK